MAGKKINLKLSDGPGGKRLSAELKKESIKISGILYRKKNIKK